MHLNREATNSNFSDAEVCLVEGDLNEIRDYAVEIELALSNRRKKIEVRHLENELSYWRVLVDHNQTLAVKRLLVFYLMRSNEIDGTVHVDLSL